MQLASNGATVSSATEVNASGATPAYCQVLGIISPVDPSAPDINFEVNLPEGSSWNHKAVQYGGSGFNGVLVTGLTPLNYVPPSVAMPLQQGYVTFGTDSGHQTSTAEIGAFALNKEALQNFEYAAYDKAHDIAIYLMQKLYASKPAEMYYYGHSEGGREALAMAQLFPGNYNGIVAMSPVINWAALQTFGNNIGILQQNGGWMDAAQVALVTNTVLSACDALDGLTDGIVSDYTACTSSVVNLQSLQCPTGTNLDTCLSTQQMALVNGIQGGYSFSFALDNGVTSYPGFGYGGESGESGWLVIMGTAAATFPVPGTTEGLVPEYGDEGIRFFVTQNANFNPISFSPTAFETQLVSLSDQISMTNPDLSAFFAGGGKLIMLEGTADYDQSPFEGITYFQSVQSTVGSTTAGNSMRLYISPGTDHNGGGVGSNSTIIPAEVDLLGTLDQWVAGGTAPGELTQLNESTTSPFSVLSSRPLCQYPDYPRYNGSGSTTSASSYTCTQ